MVSICENVEEDSKINSFAKQYVLRKMRTFEVENGLQNSGEDRTGTETDPTHRTSSTESERVSRTTAQIVQNNCQKRSSENK